VEISEKIFQHFLAHIYSGKVTKAFVTTKAVSEQKDKKCVWGVKYPPNCNIRVKVYFYVHVQIWKLRLNHAVVLRAVHTAHGCER